MGTIMRGKTRHLCLPLPKFKKKNQNLSKKEIFQILIIKIEGILLN
jgi:hypothetical protein